ncbi:ABC transporter substrate-binding protein [Cellulomonas carbonis]|uniref:Sugar ABC transporter substrate-binding protein n=1 Tax=Cellulomonas carbonis T26 TaxID=947969 RepID=A0A0A0BSX6_9CELL|nr:extracellular solute-binding protein [Cellulomonas carbonis]KGM10752.1 sugar ABC transporter substrate-binding protein [Cellulomonas carbonis T26]GGC12124.1 sugar ABC transporter substrate-binding protein [Cellulomonas carbonis]
MRTRRTTAVVAGLVALPLALTACGGGDTDAGEGGGDDTLRLWHYEGEDSAMGIAWDEAIRVFEEETGATVEFERKAFEQIQQTAGMVLSSDEGPDIMEYNKGNATAGLLASQGLLTDLTDVAEERGWAGALPESIQTTARYDERGVMGSGSWYGVPNYGEFVTVYYNEDLFAEHGVEVPSTLEDLEAAMNTFVAAGITPIATAGAEYPAGQLFYELALSKADRDFVTAYQTYTDEVDFSADPLRYGAETFAEWVDAGYVAQDAASLKAEDMGVAFINGTAPMMVSGSWWYGRVVAEAQFEWGIFNFPGNDLNAGSSGNLWVVPENSRNKELAYEFIDITMRPEIQAILGNNGGLPLAADPADITDEKSQELITAFNEVLENDGLAFYPDWPVPGYYDVLVSGFQKLINASATPDQVLEEIGTAYADGVASIE